MASYVDSQSSQTLQPRKAPGLFIYECSSAMNPVSVVNADYANMKTQPNNSYWTIWNVNDQTKHSIVSDDPRWTAGWSVNRGVLWTSDSRSLIVPYTGLYDVTFRIGVLDLDQLGTDGTTFAGATYKTEQGGVLFGIVKDVPAGSGTFAIADGTHPDPLLEAYTIPFTDFNQTVDTSGLVITPGSEAVITDSMVITPLRNYFPAQAGGTYVEDKQELNAGSVSGKAYLTAGQQLRFVVSNYNATSQPADPAVRTKYAASLVTTFVPTFFNVKLAYINGAYKV